MKFCKLRIAWSVGWGVAAVLLCVLWVHSNNYLDLFGWQISATKELAILLDNGGLYITTGGADALASRNYIIIPTVDPSRFLTTGVNGPRILRFPLWSLLALSLTLSAAPWHRWRFSLRTLLIATALVAVVLGLVVWFSSV